MIGDTIGNFVIIGQLGKGGMGEVWLAEHKDLGYKVAIKTLRPQISEDKQQVERFFGEAVAVSKIKHAGITKIFDNGFSPSGQAYLVMEYLEGESLATRIARVRRLRLAELTDIARQIASVLEATHAEGITHRDLKPDNLFLVPDSELPRGERVKVLDFGIAKLSGGTGLTGSAALGTPLYMSPEQWKTPGAVDGRADVYSLGCLVFEMATGRPPFTATSIGEACTLHLSEPAPLLRTHVASLPMQLESVVTNMLAKDADARPTVRDVKLTFGAIEERAASEPSDPDAFSPTLRPEGGPAGPLLAAELYGTDVANAAAATVATIEPKRAAAASPPQVATTLGSAASMVGVGVGAASARRPRRNVWPVVAVVAVIAAAGAVVAVLARGGDNANTPAIADDSAALKPSIPAPPPSVPTVATEPTVPTVRPPPPTPAATKSSVRVKATPATAEIRIDDLAVANPFHADFTRDAVAHRITVSAPGFQPKAELVTFDLDRDLSYDLIAAVPVDSGKPRTLPKPPSTTIYHGTKGQIIVDDPAKRPR